MYPNLRAEKAKKKKTSRDLANALDISESTYSLKENGKGTFTLNEAKAIKAALESDMPLEELFETEEGA